MSTRRQQLLAALASLVCLGCAVTEDDVHRWGAEARYQVIRDTLKAAHDERLKVACAVELGRGHFEPAIPELIRLTSDDSPRVRLAAVTALGAYAGRDVYMAILQRLSDPNDAVEEAAERILRTWGEESYDIVLEALNDRSFEVRAGCAALLGRMGGEVAGKALVGVAQHDPNPVVRRQAVRALGTMQYAKASSALWRIQVTDTATEVALEAGKALEAIGGVAFPWSITFVPYQGSDPMALLGAAILEALQSEVSKRRLCPVVAWPLPKSGQPTGDQSPSCYFPGLANAKVDDVALVRVQGEGNKVVAILERYRVSENRLWQTETCVGYLAEPEKLIEECVHAFTQSYQ